MQESGNYRNPRQPAFVMKIHAENALKMENFVPLNVIIGKSELLEEYCFTAEGSRANTS